MLLPAESAVKPKQQLPASYNTAEARTAQLVCRTAGPQRPEGLGLQDLGRAGRYRHASIAILMDIIIIKVHFDEEHSTSTCIDCDTVDGIGILKSILRA